MSKWRRRPCDELLARPNPAPGRPVPLSARGRSGMTAGMRGPIAVLLAFAAAVLACNVLTLLQRAVEQAHQQQEPPAEVSTHHLAVQIRGSYEGLLIAVPPECWPPWHSACSAWPATSTQRNSPPASANPSRKHPRATSIAKPHANTSQPHA